VERAVQTTKVETCEECFRDFECDEIVAYATIDDIVVCHTCANRLKQQAIQLVQVIPSEEDDI
jgi:hypothetical protein